MTTDDVIDYIRSAIQMTGDASHQTICNNHFHYTRGMISMAAMQRNISMQHETTLHAELEATYKQRVEELKCNPTFKTV